MMHFDRYRWEDHVARPGRWKLDLLLAVLSIGVLTAALHPGASGTAALTSTQDMRGAPPFGDDSVTYAHELPARASGPSPMKKEQICADTVRSDLPVRTIARFAKPGLRGEAARTL